MYLVELIQLRSAQSDNTDFVEIDGSKDTPRSLNVDTLENLLAELRAACDVSLIVATYVGLRAEKVFFLTVF